jgi:HlyD family secretion protein
MQVHKKTTVILFLIALAGLIIWQLTRPEPVKAVIKTVDRGLVEATVANTRAGTVHSCRRANLAPPMGGQIANLLVEEGDKVKQNQVLLELWNADLSAQALLAEEDVVSVKAKADQACVVAAVSDKEAKRLVRLYQQQLASEEQKDKAEGEARANHAACAAARASIKVASARYRVALANLERTRLRAPFDGTVAEINGELGEFVTPSPVGVPTLPAVDLVDNSCIYVTAPIDEVDAPNLRKDMPARISLDAFSGRYFEGRIRRVAEYVLDREKQARTVDIEVDFTNPSDTDVLLPGYSADVEVILQSKPGVVRIPTEALMEGNQVLVWDPDSEIAEQRQVKTGISNWVYTEVTDGLSEGMHIVTSVDREGVSAGAHLIRDDADDQS